MAHILIPTDFSPNALNAALYAMELYGAEGNTFTILHCYMMSAPGRGVMLNIDDQLKKNAMEDLAAFVDSLRAKLPGSRHQMVVKCERGYVPEVISVYKDREDAPDIVVMGTQGATGIEHVLMGTNTADAIKRGGLPLLAVPAQAVFEPPGHIILADDSSPVAPTTANALLDIVQRTGARVAVLRMINEDVHAGTEEPQICSFETVFGAQAHSHVYMSGTDLLGVIDEQIERSGAGMIAIVHRERGWLEGLFHRSLSARLAMHTHIPLLVLQDPGA
ncbi:MAG TPA: universal stress protein [Flavobacteriales bacterium]|nr:universal stress protein [Flavobacteriales bacterium]